jgi:hypothetical protein
VIPRDTSPAAWEAYQRRLAELTPQEKISIAAGLCEVADSLQRAGLRQLYPGADEAELTFRLAAAKFGEELARKAYRRA